MTTIVAPPSNASKWQMGFNLVFKGLKCSVECICVLYFLGIFLQNFPLKSEHASPHNTIFLYLCIICLRWSGMSKFCVVP